MKWLHIAFIVCAFQASLCIAKADYGDSCDSKFMDCDRSKYLLCIDGKCNCTNPETMYYNVPWRSCVVKVHESCLQEEIFTRQTVLDDGHNSSNPGNVASHTVKLKRTLLCGPGLVCEFGKICQNRRLSWGKPCDYTGENKCPGRTGLICRNGKCKCRLESQQHFNGKKCVTNVGGICGTYNSQIGGEIQLECTKYSDCVPGLGHSTCKCQQGFDQSSDGKCLSGYNMTCDEHQRCIHDSLNCIDGKCLCEDFLEIYDEREKRCRGLVGSPCLGKSYQYCVNNAVCYLDHQLTTNRIQNVCRCQTGYNVTTNRMC